VHLDSTTRPSRITDGATAAVRPPSRSTIEQRLRDCLAGDLGFRGRGPTYASHNTHAFAARFPPELPRLFIDALTEPGEVVLDPMGGSGTTVVEAALAGRRGLAIDLDPLAVKVSQAKVLPFPPADAAAAVERIVAAARQRLAARDDEAWRDQLAARAAPTRQFIAYWFETETARELSALSTAIGDEVAPGLAAFLETVFSALIVTKSGGVSLARDLAHSRPHRVDDKTYRDAVGLFETKARKAIASLAAIRSAPGHARTLAGDARRLPLADASVDLIVTSPPYVNAIDYMRAHKFSLVWLGHETDALGRHRRAYVGAERRAEAGAPLASPLAEDSIRAIAAFDPARAAIVRRYFVEMSETLAEMGRVVRPGRAIVVVVGSSTVRGIVVPTAAALAELAPAAGLALIDLRERPIDRDRRLMPVSAQSSGRGIEARMHSEHVIGLVKP
jgi:DNA modification methylase